MEPYFTPETKAAIAALEREGFQRAKPEDIEAMNADVEKERARLRWQTRSAESRVDRIAFIDTETTGLERRHRVIQHGICVLDAHTLDLVESRRAYVRLGQDDLAAASVEAMKVHGISPDTLVEHGKTVHAALEHVYGWLDWEKTLPAFWPVEFDLPFIQREYDRIGAECPFPRRCLDVRSAAYFALFQQYGVLDNPGLKDFMKRTVFLNDIDLPLPTDLKEHDALYDASVTANAFRRICVGVAIR